jgi:hypothetical protein
MNDDAPLIVHEDDAVTIGYVKDFSSLLRAIDEVMPKEAVLYLEGTSVAPDVVSFLEARPAQNPPKVEANTLWPKPKVFHMPLAGDNLAELRKLADKHAQPEVADHLVVYRGAAALLWAHDAGDGYVDVARTWSESTAKPLRNALRNAIKSKQ